MDEGGKIMKLFNLILGLAVIFLGILPFLVQQGITVFSIIPSSGNMYQGLIVILGVVIVILNYKTRSDFGTRYRR